MPDGVAPFFDQLSAPARVLDVRPRPVPCVLLLSRSCDADLDSVQDLLAGVGIRALRLNSEELTGAGLIVDTDGRAACVRGRWIVPTVTWARHFSVRAIEDGGGPAYRVFLQESWQAAAGELAEISATSIGPYGPGPLAQLRLARRHEIAVPRTMLTTDPFHARDAFTCPRLVVKAVHGHFVEAVPGRLSGIFPTVVERTALPCRPRPGPPVLVQEYVEHEAEWRVYYVAGQVHGFEVGKESPADPWTAADRVEIRSAEPPAAVRAATTRLAAAMSLRFGAFDFLVRDGVPVFLEANPDGDWRWAEEKAGVTPVTNAVTRMLTDLHHAALSGSFDLLGFLARPTGTG